MEYKMRRVKKALSPEKTDEILKNGEYGFLALVTPDGGGYGVAMNYVYDDGKIYLHGALQGLKIDCVNANGNVCFTVIAKAKYIERAFTTRYESAVAFGTARVADDDGERLTALKTLCAKYSPDLDREADAMIEKSFARTAIIVIDVETATGKGDWE
jgi:nitroimidazol reductase NimA-like FMN-containing flavoprotein (pyridoxamine 5'-phosphate oxidase superfamily)